MTHSINKRRFFWISIALVIYLSVGGCTARIGNLTFVSTKNIDLSDTNLDARTGKRYVGEDCGFYLLGIPLHFPNLQEAIDRAIETGKGTVMVDEVTEIKRTWMVLGTQVCLTAEGTVLNAPLTSVPKATK